MNSINPTRKNRDFFFSSIITIFNTPVRSVRSALQSLTRVRLTKVSGIAIVGILMISACGGGTSGSTSPSGDVPDVPDVPDVALDCLQADYACSWNEVSEETIEQSLVLSEQASALLESGLSTAEVVAWLKQQTELAEIIYEDGLVRFRLPGGRPVWLATKVRLESESMMAQVNYVARDHDILMAKTASMSAAAESIGVVRPEVEDKRALILVPHRFETNSGDGSKFSGGLAVADSLSNTRGYSGAVMLLQNETDESENVTVDSFSSFNDYDVIYAQTYGFKICSDLETGQSIPCVPAISAQVFHGGALDLVNMTTFGVEVMVIDDERSFLVLGADYFRNQYPGGLKNKLVFFAASEGYNTTMADALEGEGSNYISWNEDVLDSTSNLVSSQLFDGLASGRTLQSVYVEMSADGSTHDDVTGADLIIGENALRIRELLTLRDASSGDVLVSGESIRITGTPEDGNADHIELLIDVDGVEEWEASNFMLHLEVDGNSFTPLVVEEAGTESDTYTWVVNSNVPLGVDVQSGQVLNIKAWVDLPEGGQSTIERAPKVTQPALGLGNVYQGTATRIWHLAGGPTVTAIAHVSFQLEGSLNQPVAEYGVVDGGYMTVIFSDNPDGSSCSYSGQVDVPITFSPLIRLLINTSTMEYSAKGYTSGPNFDVAQTCPGQDTDYYPFETNSLWLVVNEDDHYVTDGSTISGTFQSSATSQFSWSFEKVE
jgi:hypothetical protein